MITESQNGLVWQAPLEATLSKALLKKGYLESVTQDCVQTVLE